MRHEISIVNICCMCPKNQHSSAVKDGKIFFHHKLQYIFSTCVAATIMSRRLNLFLYAHKLINFRHSGANIIFHAFFVLL